jgi:hypothetical protein
VDVPGWQDFFHERLCKTVGWARFQIEHVTNLLARRAHAAATTLRHVSMADVLVPVGNQIRIDGVIRREFLFPPVIKSSVPETLKKYPCFVEK